MPEAVYQSNWREQARLGREQALRIRTSAKTAKAAKAAKELLGERSDGLCFKRLVPDG